MQVDAAVEAARRAAQPARKTFAIGFQTGHEMNWLPRAMHVLHDELKNIQVTVSSDYSPDLAEALARGRLDLAFLRVEPGYDLEYHVVDREPLIVLMPSDHRLTAREAVRPQDFVGEIFIGGSNKADRAARRHRGLSPPLGARHQTGSRGGQHGDGHVPGRIHPRAGADARLCQEPAAVVRRQPSAGRRGTDDRCSGGLQQVEHLADSRSCSCRGSTNWWGRTRSTEPDLQRSDPPPCRSPRSHGPVSAKDVRMPRRATDLASSGHSRVEWHHRLYWIAGSWGAHSNSGHNDGDRGRVGLSRRESLCQPRVAQARRPRPRLTGPVRLSCRARRPSHASARARRPGAWTGLMTTSLISEQLRRQACILPA